MEYLIKFIIDNEECELKYNPDNSYNNSGGNANVLFYKNRYAVKILKKIDDEEKYRRFINEIHESEKIRKKYPDAIIPILYSNIPPFKELKNLSNFCYYVMPKCEKINGVKDFDEYIEILLDVTDSLDKIHKCGYAHRDVKMSNILKYNGKWILSDYGCIFPYDGERISGNGEKVGPEGCPEELKHVDANASGMNKKNLTKLYQSSDCFLFAKMIWHLVCKGEIFHGSFKQGDMNYNKYIDDVERSFGNQLMSSLLEIMEKTIIYETKKWKERLTLVDIIDKLNHLYSLVKRKDKEYEKYMLKQKLLFVTLRSSKTYSSYTDYKIFIDILSVVSFPLCFNIDKVYFADEKLDVSNYERYENFFIFKNEICNVIFSIGELKIYDDMSKLEIITDEIKDEKYAILQELFNNPRYNCIIIKRKIKMSLDVDAKVDKYFTN